MRRPEGRRIWESEELLHRQVHPAFIEEDRVSSEAFRVTSSAWKPDKKRDENLLSVARNDFRSAKAAYLFHIKKVGRRGSALKSAGTWSVLVEESEEIGLPVYEDPVVVEIFEGAEIVEELDESHAVIDFQGCSNKEKSRAAKKLAWFANKRGPTYLPS